MVLGLGSAGFVRAVQPDPPGAFYDPPDPLPAGPPGTIIRSEDDPQGGLRIERMLYTSTNPGGEPVAVSGALAAPRGDAPPGGWPVVAWAHGTRGVARRCAPSISDGKAGLEQVPGLDRLVAAGNVVVATDYPGLGTPGMHPYLVGESEGRAVLDSVRAAHQLLGADASDVTAVFGHSQGGHATLFAAQLAPTHAPELDLVGAAPMAPPTALGESLERSLGEPPGIVRTSLAITSWSTLYPGADESDIAHESARGFVRNIGRRCVATTAQGLAMLPDVLALKVRFLSRNPVGAPGWDELLKENSPADPIAAPVLLTQGTTDPLVQPDVTAEYVQRQCAAGTAVDFRRYAGTGHFALQTVAAPDVVAWLLDRVGGDPAPAGCTTRQVDPSSG